MHQPQTDADLLRAAFRDVHAARLHGFALVLLLGRRREASLLAAETLARHTGDAARLRHPERAAAVLRGELLRRARRLRSARTQALDEQGAQALTRLSIDAATARALSTLDLPGRAALVATEIERFGEADVAVILGCSIPRARHAAAAARSRYVARYVRPDSDRPRPGSIGRRVDAVASRAMGSSA